MERPAGDRPLSHLFSVLGTQVQQLIRTECQLARKEIGDNIAKARAAFGLIAVGLVLLLPAITILLIAVVNGLVRVGLRADLAALAVGAMVVAISVTLILTGIRRANAVSFVPEKSLSQLQRDLAAVNPMRQKNEHETA